MNSLLSWLGLETGHNALEIGHSLVSIHWELTLLHFLWQGAIIGLLASVAGFLEIEYEDKDAATWRADAQPLAEE
jgi:hypothetical protein